MSERVREVGALVRVAVFDERSGHDHWLTTHSTIPLLSDVHTPHSPTRIRRIDDVPRLHQRVVLSGEHRSDVGGWQPMVHLEQRDAVLDLELDRALHRQQLAHTAVPLL